MRETRPPSRTRISRVLVANRGEIALRIVRACADEGLSSVVVVSEADVDSLPAQLADEWVCIGPAAAAQSYLSVSAIIAAAVATGCDAIHPGYGFLSERVALAEACERHGLRFVGPSVEAIRQGGDKVVARTLAQSLGIPVSGGADAIDDAEEGARLADDLGYPVLIKAAAGGGGRGMVLVHSAEDLQTSFARASSEAFQAFGDGRVYIERYLADARHVEVQVLGDDYGAVVHLGDRDCSCQRRYQKIVEEAPASEVSPAISARLASAATALAAALAYSGAGTVEFLVDRATEEFVFLEMNTRIQVEHPVTELVTGVDIVREQLRIAGGAPLSFAQEAVTVSGHAVECRINAEDPAQDFRPMPGRIVEWVMPQGVDVRVDSHCFAGYTIPPFYDSLMGKLIAHGPDRATAIRRMESALERVRISGVTTNLALLQEIVGNPDFRAGRLNTRWLETELLSRQTQEV